MSGISPRRRSGARAPTGAGRRSTCQRAPARPRDVAILRSGSASQLPGSSSRRCSPGWRWPATRSSRHGRAPCTTTTPWASPSRCRSPTACASRTCSRRACGRAGGRCCWCAASSRARRGGAARCRRWRSCLPTRRATSCSAGPSRPFRGFSRAGSPPLSRAGWKTRRRALRRSRSTSSPRGRD